MNNSIDQQFVEYIVKSLVGNPDMVQVDRRIDEKGVLLELTVDPEDLGRVIGKRGATAQSLRTLLRALGTKNEARYNLKIVDNGEPHTPSDSGHTASDDSRRQDDRYQSDTQSVDTSNNNVTNPQNDDLDEDDTSVSDKRVRESDVVSKTRRELEELDDLDV